MKLDDGQTMLPTPGADRLSSSYRTPPTYKFSIPLNNEHPKPKSFLAKLTELWKNPQPINSVIRSNRCSYVDTKEGSGTGNSGDFPYCIISDEFDVGDSARFQVLLYPHGRFIGKDSPQTSNGIMTGLAGTYLKYTPK